MLTYNEKGINPKSFYFKNLNINHRVLPVDSLTYHVFTFIIFVICFIVLQICLLCKQLSKLSMLYL